MLDPTPFLTERLNEDEAIADNMAKTLRSIGQPVLGDGPLSPGRVWAEVAAKRLLLKWHYPDGGECAECMALAWPCNTILAMCSVYQDHEGFREEWKL
jgi:hypothetical protein